MKYTADYSRQLQLLGITVKSQEALANSHILVFGAGGLGVTALSYLASAGIGAITIVDHDTIEASNLHRQTIYRTSDISKPKATTAKQYLSERAPDCTLKAVSSKLNINQYFELCGQSDIILDCTDDMQFSYQLNDIALCLNKPVVFANASGFSGQLFVMQPAIVPTICLECVWPKQTAHNQTCDILGVLGPIPAAIGCMQALEVIKLITECQPPQTHTLLNYDFISHQTMPVKIKDTQCVHKHYKTNLLAKYSYTHDAGKQSLNSLVNQSLEAIANSKELRIIDIRNTSEVSVKPCPVDHLHIEMAELLNTPDNHLSGDENYLIICATGKRSAICAELLQGMDYKTIAYPATW